VIFVVITPASGAVPMLVIVTGTLLGEPATNGVNGCPIDVIKSDDVNGAQLVPVLA
jgi:hypothetical protein